MKFIYAISSIFLFLIISCSSNHPKLEEPKVENGEIIKYTFKSTFGHLPNENRLLKGSWKVDSIQFSEKTIYPLKEAYLFKDTTGFYLRGNERMVREDYVGIYRYYNDTLTFFIEHLSSGSNPQQWKLEIAKKNLVMHALYKTSQNESPILYLTKTSYQKLTFGED